MYKKYNIGIYYTYINKQIKTIVYKKYRLTGGYNYE